MIVYKSYNGQTRHIQIEIELRYNTSHRLSDMAHNKTTKVKTVGVPRRKDGEIDGRCKTEKLLKQNKSRDNRSTKTVDTCGNSTRMKKIGIPKKKDGTDDLRYKHNKFLKNDLTCDKRCN